MRITGKNSIRLAGIISILVSCAVLADWFFDLSLMRLVFPDFISMKFNSAICFLLLGIALVLLGKKHGSAVCTWCLLLVILIGLLTLIEYVFSVNIGIDELLWKEGPGAPYTLYPGRPSGLTAINFILIGFVLININSRKTFVVNWLILNISMLIATVSCISFLFGNPELISIPSLSFIALHTAVLFMVICIGIFYSDYFQNTALSFQRRMIAGFLVIAFVILLVVYLDKKSDKNLIDTAKLVSSNNETISIADDMITSIARMESGSKGYLLTRDSSLLGPLAEDRRNMVAHLEQLKKVTAGHASQRLRLESLSELISARIDLFDSLFLLPVNPIPLQNNTRDVIIRTPALMNRIIDTLNGLKQQEKELLFQQQARNDQHVTEVNQVMLLLGFCILAIFLLLIRFIFKNTNARIKAEAAALQLTATLEKKVAERIRQLNRANEQLRRLTGHLQTVREDDRQYFSREVHDELGQLAAALKMDMDWLQLHVTDADPKVKTRISNASYVLQTMINSVREIASSIRPVMIDELGLNASLTWLCGQFTKTNGISCEFAEEMDDTVVPQQTRTELFRICQEALSNIKQHAKASRVKLRLRKITGGMELSVSDNGKGFDVAHNSDRLGLIGIRERVLRINGSLAIESGKNKGTIIKVTVPLAVGING